ncbi:DUF1961 family protein [Mucisphaera calidilacus]|uniref:Uncharacterized protein n=1 Tax=Mucisphaera calidilacus TaxID=2527982 RepID=A0A518BWY1_9BACT|nr:DUF1961 family protein [Mucisphaera calidilacus]QDU71476.1 hypothetical protein Pan265_13260 [Mucisphaera calidilacus]
MNRPTLSYDLTDGNGAAAFPRDPGRLVTRLGHTGRHFDRLHGGFALTRHTLNEPRGAVGVWVCPLDDLGTQAQYPQHRAHNHGYDQYVFLSDRESPLDPRPAQFAMYFHTYWHPVFMAKWHRGGYDELCWTPRPGASAMAGHLRLPRDRWTHLACSWDRERGDYRLYVNGWFVGAQDTTYEGVLPQQPAGPILYGGAPRVAYGRADFWDQQVTADEIRQFVTSSDYPLDAETEEEVQRVHGHKPLRAFEHPQLDREGWEPKLRVSLTQQEDLLAFYHQGANNGTTVSSEGTRIQTPSLEAFFDQPDPPGGDTTRMYLWTRQCFEGDLYVTFRFRIHRPGGLALLMTQAAGMHGEDFLHTYHPRTDGAMKMVCWEDVRNYHWEFMRQMHDIRNDVINHAMLKNPWYCPVAYQALDEPWEMDRTYRLHYLQRGNHIVGAIDDRVVIDAHDSPWTNNGPVLRNGAVALRCMMRTDMTFRDLEIYNRDPGLEPLV